MCFEKRRFEVEEKGRDEERAERRRGCYEHRKERGEEIEARDSVELEEFKMMTDMVKVQYM